MNKKANIVTIKVTSAHINKAYKDRDNMTTQCMSTLCPIAQAMKQQGIKFRGVDCTSVIFVKRGKVVTIPLPENAIRLVKNFDFQNHDYVKPIQFRISIPN